MSSPDPLPSAHWPPGWSRHRLLHSSSASLLALPDSERDLMYSSLRDILGPDGFKALLDEMSANYQARLAAGRGDGDDEQRLQELPPHLQAPFLATLRQLYDDANVDGNDGLEISEENKKRPWGFVVYRLAGCGDEESLWAAFRERWDEILRARMGDYEGVPGVAEAVQRVEFRWVEEKGLEAAGLGSVARHYRHLLTQQPPLPPGLAHPLCLAITPSSLSSVLSSPLPSSAPLSDRKSIPFAVAIDKTLDEVLPPEDPEGTQAEQLEGSEAPRSFNVAVESLLDELFPVVGGGLMAVDELAVGMGPKRVWVSGGGRYGFFEMED